MGLFVKSWVGVEIDSGAGWGMSRALCAWWDGEGRGQTPGNLEDIQEKAGPERGAESPSAVRDGGWVHLCGPPADVRPRWRGRRGCWRPGLRARRGGWRSRGAVEASGGVAERPGAGSPHPWPATSPAGLAGAARVVGCARAGGGEPGRPSGRVGLAACAAPAPRDAGQVSQGPRGLAGSGHVGFVTEDAGRRGGGALPRRPGGHPRCQW